MMLLCSVLCKAGVSTQALIANILRMSDTLTRPQSSSALSLTLLHLCLCQTGVGKYCAFVLSCLQAEAFFFFGRSFICSEFQTLSSLQTFHRSLTHHIRGLAHLHPGQTHPPTQGSLGPANDEFYIASQLMHNPVNYFWKSREAVFFEGSYEEINVTFSAVPLLWCWVLANYISSTYVM